MPPFCRAVSLLVLVTALPTCAFAAATGTPTTRQSGSNDLSRSRSGGGLPDPRLTESGSRPADNVVILSVTPAKPQPGIAQTVTVRVKYTLITAPKGLVSIGFNTNSAASFRLVKERWVGIGTGELEFTAEIVPARWADKPFKAYANISKEAQVKQRTSLAADVVPVKLD